MKQETTGLGLRLRNTRRQRGLSLDTLAAKSALTKSYLSKIERAEKVPSLASILKITKAFGIQVGHLFGEATEKEAICVVRKGERKPIARPGAKMGYKYEALAYKRRSKCMEAFIMHPPRQFEDESLFEHEGEELIFVLRGKVEMVFVDRKVVLGTGDSIYFDGCHLHRSRALTDSAETLVVVGGVGASSAGRSARNNKRANGKPTRIKKEEKHGYERAKAIERGRDKGTPGGLFKEDPRP